MKTEIDLDAILIDGARLKAAREERGTSVAEMAASITLSREQILAIENGGYRPFYTPAHKLLAVRKYTAALEIAYDEVVTGPGADQTIPVPDDAPVSMMSPSDMPEPTDLRLAAVERNAELRRLLTLGAIALCIVLAIYAKLRGASEGTSDEDTAISLTTPESELPPQPVVPAVGPVTAGKADAAAKADAGAKVDAAAKVDTAAKADAATRAESSKQATASNEDCPTRVSGEVKTWSPPYQRKNDLRLFVVSPAGGSLCVIDGTGKSAVLSLKPMIGQAYAGKPPYTIRSADLPKMDIFMQGLKAKIPADTDTLRLIPSTQPAPAEALANPET